MSRPLELKGQRFGDLEVIDIDTEEMERRKAIGKCWGIYWKCYCHACGNYRTTTSGKLVKGHTTNCGCKRNANLVTHGKSKTKEYTLWSDMKARCYNENSKNYSTYGAKGYTVCDEWLESADTFITWFNEQRNGELGLLKIKEGETVFSPENCYVEIQRPDESLMGKRIGDLYVKEPNRTVQVFQDIDYLWTCKCKLCGKHKIVSGKRLNSRLTTSCGCRYRSYEESIDNFDNIKKQLELMYKGMKDRCYIETSTSYYNYGGRGIRICDEWYNDFEKFLIWSLDNGYEMGLSIERKDANKNYSPENCEWVTRDAQARNKRNNVFILFEDEVHIIAEWSRILGLKPENVKKHTLSNGGRILTYEEYVEWKKEHEDKTE